MTPREMALRLALVKVLGDELKTAKAVTDGEIRDEWRPKDRITATLPDGREVGTVTLTSGRKAARLSDEIAYEMWVRVVHPDAFETVTVTRVKPEFTERLMSAARKLGVAVDAETGEEVPGITVAAGEPFPMVKLASDAREAVAEAWQSGELTELVSGLLAIEGDE